MRAAALIGACVALLALAACDSTALAPRKTSVTPEARPQQAAPVAAPAPLPAQTAARPSANSLALAQYYRRFQDDLLVRGLLRTDGGGPDTIYTDTMLARNFEAIALRDEFVNGDFNRPGGDTASPIKKWRAPIRIQSEFGAGVPMDVQVKARNEVALYARRLARVTGHPISVTGTGGNFHVLFMSETDRAAIVPRIRQIVPDISGPALSIFDSFPRDVHCLVLAFATRAGGYEYGQAIAVIRSEHPDLLRQSCIHEEIAQGLGLANDDPRARPSIFNDDDEFAYLTTHDEMLLQILYDPRLTPGMSPEAARPIVRERASRLLGGNS